MKAGQKILWAIGPVRPEHFHPGPLMAVEEARQERYLLIVSLLLRPEWLLLHHPGPAPPGRRYEVEMRLIYALIAALAVAALACQAEPAPSPTPIALSGLTKVEFSSHYWPTGISGDQSVGVGQEREVHLANVRTGEVRQLTNDGHRKSDAVISGNLVAWTDQRREIETTDNNSTDGRGLADDVFVLDLDTGEQRRITEVPAERHGLRFSGDWLVWQDNRNEFDEHYTHYDIYAYDLEADEEIAVAVAPGAQWVPAVHENFVVWADNRNRPKDATVRPGCFDCPDNRFDIYTYDFNTGEERVIYASGANNTTPDIHGRRVVWRGFDDEGHTTIHLYDLDSGHLQTLDAPGLSGGDKPYSVGRLLVSGNFVVWTQRMACDVIITPSRERRTGVFAYDLRTDEVRQLSNYVEPRITVDGNVVVVHEGCQVGGRVYAVFLE